MYWLILLMERERNNELHNTQVSMNTNELLKERRAEYGEAWLLAGDVLRFLGERLYQSPLVLESVYFHNWILILSKLMRAIRSPNNGDHWNDISGYALLVSRYIEEREKSYDDE